MECRLPIVRSDFDATERAGCLFRFVVRLVAVAASLLVGYYLTEHRVLVTMLVLLALTWGLEVLLRRTFPDWARKRDLIGEVVFKAAGFELNVGSDFRTISFQPGAKIDLDTHHIQGRPRGYRDFLRNGVGTLTVEGDQDIVTLKFLVRSKRDLADLLAVLKTWYRKGYQVHETMGDKSMSVFLLKWDWSFEELQAAKKEYGLVKLWPSIKG